MNIMMRCDRYVNEEMLLISNLTIKKDLHLAYKIHHTSISIKYMVF